MRKLLCGIAAGVFALMFLGGIASAAESGTISKSEAAEEMKVAGEHAGLDHEVVECIENAAKNNDTERCIKAPSPIMPATNELVYGGLAFFVLLGVLWKFGLPAATKMANERTQKISDSLDAADKAKVDAESVLAEYQRQLADAKAESSRIIDEARAQADQVKRDLIAKAEAEVAELRQRNAEAIAGERGRVMGELQGQVAALAIELAEKVVESNLDRETNTRLIENYINSVGAR